MLFLVGQMVSHDLMVGTFGVARRDRGVFAYSGFLDPMASLSRG